MTPEVVKVAVLGAQGRMGSASCDALQAAEGVEVVARIGRHDPLEAMIGADVALDFTVPGAAGKNVVFALSHGLHAVVGTSGISDADLASFEDAARRSETHALVVPNFALGAVLMMRFAALAAPYYDYVEIVERHHERKLDAPSGTSLRTAALIEEARGTAPPRRRPDGREEEAVPGARGARPNEAVRIHSLRLRGSVAHQEVIFGGQGETLTLRHDSLDRSSFMPGVVLAVRRVGDLERPVTVGLEHLLGI